METRTSVLPRHVVEKKIMTITIFYSNYYVSVRMKTCTHMYRLSYGEMGGRGGG